MIYRRKKRNQNVNTAKLNNKDNNKDNNKKNNKKEKSILLPFFLTLIILALIGIGAYFIGIHFAKDYFSKDSNKNKTPLIEKMTKPNVSYLSYKDSVKADFLKSDIEVFYPPYISYKYKRKKKEEKKLHTNSTNSRKNYSSNGVYYLQAGLFLKRSNAEVRILKLRNLGYSGYIQLTYSYGRKMYKVVLGRYSSRQQAQSVKSKLVRAGFSDIFVLSY